MLHSIRWRLVLSYMLITLLAVAVVGSVTYQIVATYVQQREVAGLETTAQAVAKQAFPYLWPVVRYDELTKIAETAAFLGDVRVRIYDKHDKVLVDSGSPNTTGDLMVVMPFLDLEMMPVGIEHLPMIFLKQEAGKFIQEFQFKDKTIPPGASVTIIQRSGDPWSGGYVFKELSHLSELQFEISQDGEEIHRSTTSLDFAIGDLETPQGYVELSALPDYGSAMLYQVRQALFFGGGGAVLLAGIAGLWISQRLASPLKDLTKTAARMGAGDLSVRAEIKDRGEIGALAGQFNQMASELETNFNLLEAERDALRRFITDASHELRTPITALKNFNSLLRDPALRDPAARDEFLTESRDQVERLEWITNNLLDLSRLDSGLSPLDIEDHDLREIVETVVEAFRNAAEEREIELSSSLPESEVLLSCDRFRLEIALSNLVENALKYTQNDGEVEIGIEDQEGVQIWVRDNGVGILAEDLPHIFERFYRGKVSEGAGQTKTGSGLGLAIVKSIVEAHDGSVAVESTARGGTTFTIQF